MENRYKKIKIEQIPSGNYEGYYWLSNASKPEVIKGQDIDKTKFGVLPFVVEANFYCRDTETSIQIKNIDGIYHVAQIDVKDCDAVKYIGHDIGADFLVVEAWEVIEDEFLENMKTQVPAWTAFKGFVEPKK